MKKIIIALFGALLLTGCGRSICDNEHVVTAVSIATDPGAYDTKYEVRIRTINPKWLNRHWNQNTHILHTNILYTVGDTIHIR